MDCGKSVNVVKNFYYSYFCQLCAFEYALCLFAEIGQNHNCTYKKWGFYKVVHKQIN